MDLVSTAVSFLSNARVKGNSEDQKRFFLISKGLTPHEIDMAIDFAKRGVHPASSSRAATLAADGAHPLHRFDQMSGSAAPAVPHVFRHDIHYDFPGSFAMTRALVPSLLLFSGLVYGAYLLLRRWRVWMWGERKHPLLQVQECLQQLTVMQDSLSRRIDQLEQSILSSMRRELESLVRPTAQEVAAVAEIKKELASIKSLLLGRKQFPESPSLTASAACIPSWQMTDDSKERQ